MEFPTYGKIHQLGHDENKEIFLDEEDEIFLEEKIDGANFRVLITDEDIIFGSRKTTLGKFTDDIGGNWKRCIEFLKEKLTPIPKKYVGLLIILEACIKHTLNYDWEHMPPCLGLDVYNLETEKYINYDDKVKIFNDLGITVVPLIKKIKAKDIKTFTDKDVPISKYVSPSAIPEDRQAEGAVFKNYSKQIFAKYVRDRFKEQNKEAFGVGKKFTKDDSERVVAIYGTNARIEKNIFSLINSGEKLDMPLMHKLPKLVLEDIYEENWKEICMSSWSLNFRQIKKLISKRCFSVLKQMITNTALNK